MLTAFFIWIALLPHLLEATEGRYYPYATSGPDDTASERIYTPLGQVKNPDSLVSGKLSMVFCTASDGSGGQYGCPSNWTGAVPIDLGSQLFSVLSIGGYLASAYRDFKGKGAPADPEQEYWSPAIWEDKGDFIPAPGKLVALGKVCSPHMATIHLVEYPCVPGGEEGLATSTTNVVCLSLPTPPIEHPCCLRAEPDSYTCTLVQFIFL